ncbi:uncharacterized protein CTRU02_212498 [Colletotrichum truncatum]|uniref:Uncharacterized protein n=1 Tax=Colletotrichum truncatum TaxID=5467 RepID=A0ACC3YNP1_COLTU|nr:uncharacterized protein CTRU02_05690 [Colletotrichum truncatum]KAF6794133.1 hypothetical protein CTRU02_05690 [Colletotrichum truncatum]
MNDVVAAWLQDVIQAEPAVLPSPPPSPTHYKRKATLQREPGEFKRPAFGTAMNARQQRALRRNNKRDTSGEDRASSSASTNDVSDECPGSPTPTSRYRQHGTTLVEPGTTKTNARDSDLFFSQANQASAYTIAIGSSSSKLQSLTALSDAASKQSRSPVKGMASLQFAEKPVLSAELTRQDQIPTDISNLIKDIKRIRAGIAIVPKAMRQNIEHAIESISLLEPELDEKNIDNAPAMRPDRELQYELDTLCWVVRDTKNALSHDRSEAHWNERVHSRILIAAIERDRDCDVVDGCFVSVLNSTQATIAPACIPRRGPNIDMEAKMVDYCICISDQDVETAARKAVSTQSWSSAHRTPSSASVASSASAASMTKKRKLPSLPESINHTEYAPLTLSPITVSIETKKPGGSEDAAKAQLSVWVSGQINRLHQFLGPQPVGITLPLLCVSGSVWQVLFAVENSDYIEILHSFRLDAVTLLGCYQIVALLRALRTWSETVFRDWFLESFLAQ